MEKTGTDYMKISDGIGCWVLGYKSLLVELCPLATDWTKIDVEGKFKIVVLKGSVNILGYDLKTTDPPLFVYSPKGHSSLLSIQAGLQMPIRPEHEVRKFLKREQKGLTYTGRSGPIDFEQLTGMKGTIIAMIGFESTWCGGIRKYCPSGVDLVGPRMLALTPSDISQANMAKLIPKLGFRYLDDDRKLAVQVPPYWTESWDTITTTFPKISVATFGGKGVGKSTFNRWLINKLLSSKFHSVGILFIDVDVGQTEMTPPGVISVHLIKQPLLGPNFTHLQQPLKSFYMGTVSVTDDPTAYLNAMNQLANFVNNNDDLRNRHFVLNTMGFCTGIGEHFAVETIKMFQPNSVIQILSNDQKLCFPSLLTGRYVTAFKGGNPPLQIPSSSRIQSQPAAAVNILSHKLFKFESVCASSEMSNSGTHQGGKTPKDFREIVMASYFAKEIGSDLGTRLRILPMDKITFGSKSSNFTSTHILEIMNGNLVALCGFPEDLLTNFGTKLETCNILRMDKDLPGLPVEFYGYGIGRGIDTKERKLFIITPLTEEVLTKVNFVLTAGRIGIPASFHAFKNTHAPTVSTAAGSRFNDSSKRQFIPNSNPHGMPASFNVFKEPQQPKPQLPTATESRVGGNRYCSNSYVPNRSLKRPHEDEDDWDIA